MKTKNQLIQEFELEYPTLRIGNDEEGYTELSDADYTATIESWADRQIAKDQAQQETQDKREAALSKLAPLGLTAEDLKALGL
jgi:hypothetical protein